MGTSLQKIKRQEGVGGEVEGSPYFYLYVLLVLIGHSEYFLEIVYQFTLNSLIFIPFRASCAL